MSELVPGGPDFKAEIGADRQEKQQKSAEDIAAHLKRQREVAKVEDMPDAVTTAPDREDGERVESVDLRGLPLAEVERRLDQIALEGDFVMHGATLSRGEIDEFDPTRSRLGGKKQSIYASDNPRAALFNAVYDKHGEAAKKLRELDYGNGASSTMHMRRGEGYPAFVIPEHQAEAIRAAQEAGPDSEAYRQLFDEGIVYMLPKGDFTQDSPELNPDPVKGPETTDHEWNSQLAARPGVKCYVSPDVLADLLVFEGAGQNVEVLSTDKMMQEGLELRGKEFAQILPPGDELSAEALDKLQVPSDDPSADKKRRFLAFAKSRIGTLPRQDFANELARLNDDYNRLEAAIDEDTEATS